MNVYKDGMGDPVTLEGGQLVDYAELLRMGQLSGDLRPIFDSADSLIEKIKSYVWQSVLSRYF